MRIGLSDDLWKRIHAYLNDSGERVIFLFVTDSTGEGTWSPIDEWFLDVHRDYQISTEMHVALEPDVVPRMVKRAHDLACAVVEIHGHYWPGSATKFSRYDVAGLKELVPHILWRLPARPYFAMVVGVESFDALSWTTSDAPVTVDAVVVGGMPLAPTSRSVAMWTWEARGDR